MSFFLFSPFAQPRRLFSSSTRDRGGGGQKKGAPESLKDTEAPAGPRLHLLGFKATQMQADTRADVLKFLRHGFRFYARHARALRKIAVITGLTIFFVLVPRFWPDFFWAYVALRVGEFLNNR